jgi:hypothetical protein
MSNFKLLQDEQEAFFQQKQPETLHHIHQKLDDQQGIFRLFADVAELFMPQSINTIFKMMGSEDDAIKPRSSAHRPYDDTGFIPGGRG